MKGELGNGEQLLLKKLEGFSPFKFPKSSHTTTRFEANVQDRKFCLVGVAKNIRLKDVALEMSQPARFWLKLAAPSNMLVKSTTEEVFHAEMF